MARKAYGNDIIDIAGEIRGETEKAWRFWDGGMKIRDGDTVPSPHFVWLPKSQCQWDEESRTMTIPEWLAMEKGLI